MNVKEMFKLGVVLALFATAACVMLAFVYAGTAPIIAEREASGLKAALKEIFPDADNFEPTDEITIADRTITIQTAYKALYGGQVVGAAISVSTGSYGGPIVSLVGVSAEGKITGVRILDHSDTPGLGANVAVPSYLEQYVNKGVYDPFEVKGDVESVTASTITSRAVASSVKAAGLAVTAWLGGEVPPADYGDFDNGEDDYSETEEAWDE